jgi:nucleoside-diphosphate-sugar epimerase
MTENSQGRTMAAQRSLGRVLVTGAQGFIGARLVETLIRSGDGVVASDLALRNATLESYRACDITDRSQVDALIDGDAFDTVIHCGAVSGPMVMADRPLEIWKINALGTAHLLEAVRRQRIGRFLLCSSSSVYGAPHGAVIDEETLPDPDTVYGASKVAAEQAMTGYVREHGVDAAALCLSWVYGPDRRTPTTLEKLLKAAIAGETFDIDGAPSDMTHYLFIDDAVAGLVAAARADRLPHLVYNITAGPGRRFEEVAATVRDLVPEAHITFSRGSNRETGPTGFDLTRVTQELSYRPRVTLREGLERYRNALRGRP